MRTFSTERPLHRSFIRDQHNGVITPAPAVCLLTGIVIEVLHFRERRCARMFDNLSHYQKDSQASSYVRIGETWQRALLSPSSYNKTRNSATGLTVRRGHEQIWIQATRKERGVSGPQKVETGRDLWGDPEEGFDPTDTLRRAFARAEDAPTADSPPASLPHQRRNGNIRPWRCNGAGRGKR